MPRIGYSNIVGYQSIVGDAAAAQAAQRRAMRGAGVAYPVMGYGGGPQVQTQTSPLMRAFPLGFFSAAVGKSSAVQVTEKPQLTFRGERLLLPATVELAAPIANPFTIRSLNVGQRNQFVSSTALMAEAFFPDAVGVSLELDTATIGQDITIGVLNNDSLATHDFQAVFIGTCNLPG